MTENEIKSNNFSPVPDHFSYPDTGAISNKSIIHQVTNIGEHQEKQRVKVSGEINQKLDVILEQTSKDSKVDNVRREIKEKETLSENTEMNNNEILNKINNIEKDNISIKKDVEWLSRTILPAIIALSALTVTVMIFGYNSLNSNVNSKFDIIQQQLGSQKEINQINIEKNVSQEFLKQKK